MQKPIVCVYAMCKNEEKFVERWYNSMKFADYIVVMDTGSTDDTLNKFKAIEDGIELDEEKGCYTNGHIFLYERKIVPWNFGVARQASLELCPEDTDVYVCTDLDEFFEDDNWVDILKKKWEPHHERGVYKYSWSHHEDGTSARVFHYNKIHNKDWFWKYPVHELLCHKERGNEDYDWRNACNLFDDIHLHHFPDKTKARSYLPLLEQRAKEDPNDYYGLIYLAHEYTYQKMYQKSIDTLKGILDRYDGKMNTIEKASCYLFIGDGYRELSKLEENKDKKETFISLAACSYFLSKSTEPTYREAYLGLAKIYLDSNDYDQSIFYAKESLKHGIRHYTWLERDTSWSYEPYDILSLAYYYGGHKLESLAYAVKAYTFDKSNKRLEKNITLILNTMKCEDFV